MTNNLDFNTFDYFNENTQENTTVNLQENCDHTNIIDENNRCVCMECGQEINVDTISFDKEWKNRSNDSRKSQRCTARKQESKDILKDIENLDIPNDIKMKSNDIFLTISNGKIFRGDKRKGIIYTCVFNAFDYFPELNHLKNVTYLQEYFKLPRNIISRASSQYNILAHANGLTNEKQKIYVTPKNYIPSLVENIGGGDKEINDVMKLFEMINNNKSRTLSISRPESVAAGLVFYYYINKKQSTDINKFVKDSNAGLSPLTIKKNMEEIDRILSNIVSQ